VQTLACPIGVAPAGALAGAGAAPADLAVLAALARQTLGLPSPVIRSSPAQNALQLTNLPTWLWINPAEWVPESKTATVPGESVTATASRLSGCRRDRCRWSEVRARRRGRLGRRVRCGR